MSLRYRYRGENEGLTALFATITSLNTKGKENNAKIVHSHFPEFHHNAWTLSYVTVDNITALQHNW